jgi:hypothetical protein
VVWDSATASSEGHQQDVAKATNQDFLGQNRENGGYVQYNTEFGATFDAFAELAAFVDVVIIAHAKEKGDAKKGDWGGLNLSGQMALKLGRLANWVLYQSISSRDAGVGEVGDAYTTILGGRATETVLHTQPLGLWMAGVNAISLIPEEPADLNAILCRERAAQTAVRAAQAQSAEPLSREEIQEIVKATTA